MRDPLVRSGGVRGRPSLCEDRVPRAQEPHFGGRSTRALEDFLRPELHYRYADATTDIDENGVPMCARMGRWMSGNPQVTGTPLPADYKRRIGAVRNAIRRDTSGSRLVRAAAACVY